MNSEFARELMRLCKEGFEKKSLSNYQKIYQALAGVWIDNWERQYHTKTEKDEMYEQIKEMSF